MVAVHYPAQEAIARFAIRNTPTEIRKLVNRIRKQSPGQVRFCYEAGVCGFTLKRRIEALGCSCSVIAPSLVPTRPGERVKRHFERRRLFFLFITAPPKPDVLRLTERNAI